LIQGSDGTKMLKLRTRSSEEDVVRKTEGDIEENIVEMTLSQFEEEDTQQVKLKTNKRKTLAPVFQRKQSF